MKRDPVRQSRAPDPPKTAVRLMGKPHITHLLNTHDDAMQMLALLILSWGYLPPAQVEEGIERDWLAKMMFPEAFKSAPQAAREKVRYLVKLLDEALNIRTHDGQRERGGYKLTFDTLVVDALEIRQAAQRGRPEDVLELAAAPLLEGMAYPWLADPVFQRVGADLDIWCLKAFVTVIGLRIAEFEEARTKGGSRAQARWEEACLLLDQATSWLIGRRGLLRRKEPALLTKFSQELTEYRVRAGHPMPNVAAASGPEDWHLPDPPTDMIGRQPEMDAIRALLRTERLVTLTGMGGLGKTRLAIAVARSSRPEFSEEAVFADLSGIGNADQLAQSLASTLGLVGDGKSWQKALLSFLLDKHLLLIWDNCEQITDACRALAQDLLAACPQLKILLTSREQLGVASGSGLRGSLRGSGFVAAQRRRRPLAGSAAAL